MTHSCAARRQIWPSFLHPQHHLLRAACLFLLLVAAGSALHGQTRDPWKWPFHENSIWNMPLGDQATYLHAGFTNQPWIGVDPEFHIPTTTSTPFRSFYQANKWEDRDSGTWYQSKMRMPDSVVIPDADAVNQPNNGAAILDPDGRTLRTVAALTRPTFGGNIWGWEYDRVNLYGLGTYGSRGSLLSSIGGAIRKGELTGTVPIRHALKLVVDESFLYYSDAKKGYQWPALSADGAANATWYTGTKPEVVFGTLLALRPDLQMSTLNLETEPARKMFQALKDYGGYIMDTSGWDAFYVVMEDGVAGEVYSQYGINMSGSGNTAFKRDMNKIITNLHAVTNNTKDTIGGPGNRRVAKAPPLPPYNPALGGAMSKTGWNAWGTNSTALNAIDADPNTLFTTTANMDTVGGYLVLNLQQPRSFNRIILEAGPLGTNGTNYPRRLGVYAGTTASTVWNTLIKDVYGSAGTEGYTVIEFNTMQTWQYIAFQQTGRAPFPWTVSDINFYNGTVPGGVYTPPPTLAPDRIAVDTWPTSVQRGTALQIPVTYHATVPRNLSVSVYTPTWGWVNAGYKSVAAGIGNTTVSVTIPAGTATGGNFHIFVDLNDSNYVSLHKLQYHNLTVLP